MSSIVKVSVPFIYQALITKPLCIKPVVVCVRDQVEVDFQCVSSDDLPIGLQIVNSDSTIDLRFDGDRLWNYHMTAVNGQTPSRVTLDEIIENTQDDTKYIFSGAGAQAPFKNIWFQVNDTMHARYGAGEQTISSWLRDDTILTKENTVFRVWNDDNREAVVNLIKKTAKDSLIMDGYRMVVMSEPIYHAMTFGMGDNHASTDLVLSTVDNTQLTDMDWYGAHELDRAIAHTENIAIQRGDTDSVPVKEQSRIEIIIPQACKNKHQYAQLA